MKIYISLLLFVLCIPIFAENDQCFYFDDVLVNENQYNDLLIQKTYIMGEAGFEASDIIRGYVDTQKIAVKKNIEFDDLLYTNTKFYKSENDLFIEISAKREKRIFDVQLNEINVIDSLPSNAKEIGFYELNKFCEKDSVALQFNEFLFSAEITGSKCMDTVKTEINLKQGNNNILNLAGLGNLIIAKVDLNNNSKDELLIVNTHECMGTGSILIISNRGF